MVDDYVKKVLTRFAEGMDSITEDITDHVFLMIQRNPHLHGEYDSLINNGISNTTAQCRLKKLDYVCR